MGMATAIEELTALKVAFTDLPEVSALFDELIAALNAIHEEGQLMPIAPPALPVITTPLKVQSSSSQIANINATKPGPYRDIWVSNALAAFKFTAPRDAPLLIEDIKIDSCREVVYPSGGTPGINNITLN